MIVPTIIFAQDVRCGSGGINTAIGCIPVNNITEFASFFLRWGLAIAGGISVLMIVYAGFILISSTGDPKKTIAGQELLTSSIAGLIFLIFSIFILRLVGVDILGIPGLDQYFSS